MIEHEPCVSRGECYHSRAGKIGGRETQDTWGKTSEAWEARSRGGKIGGAVGGRKAVEKKTDFAALGRVGGRIGGPLGIRKMHATWGKTSEAREFWIQSGYRLNETWGKTSKAHEDRSAAGKKGGHKTSTIPGHLQAAASLGAKALHGKTPTQPEAIFYGLVFGDLITAEGFSAQQSDGHGIYDGAWLDQKIVVELDGGGHHAFRDRHADDARKDAARMLDHNKVLREQDEGVLFLKALAILETKT